MTPWQRVMHKLDVYPYGRRSQAWLGAQLGISQQAISKNFRDEEGKILKRNWIPLKIAAASVGVVLEDEDLQ